MPMASGSCQVTMLVMLFSSGMDAKSGEVQLMLGTHDTNDTLSWFEFCPTGGLLAAR